MRFILASQSPRRRALLALLGYPFEVTAADVDETLVQDADPALNALRTAELKAAAIADSRDVLLTADTNVAVDGEILGKPADAADAARMLRRLRGRTHTVSTGFVLLDGAAGRRQAQVHTAVVTMRPYGDAEIAAYVATGDPLDKAGAYGIQHPEFRPVARLDGCFAGVMGLSVCQVLQALAAWGVPLRADAAAVRRAHQGYPCPLYASLWPESF